MVKLRYLVFKTRVALTMYRALNWASRALHEASKMMIAIAEDANDRAKIEIARRWTS